MSKKKILFVINSLGCGGAEKSLVSLLSLFDLSKYEVDLQMFNPSGMFIPLLPREVHVLPELPYITFCREGGKNLRFLATRLCTSIGLRLNTKCNGKPLHDAQAFWRFASYAFDVQRSCYDAAIAWGQGNPTHYVAEKVTARKKIAVVNADYEAVGHNKWFDYPYYEKYDHIAAVSDALCEIIEKVYPDLADRMVTLYDIRNQTIIEKMAAEGDPYIRTPGTPVMVTVGRMVSQKGYDLAVATGKVLMERGVRFHWYLIGDGPERENIQKAVSEYGIEDCMFLVGAKENPYPYMKHADIYVQTSRFEGFCLTLCEARCLNTPPVSTNFDVVYDQIRDGENGLIVEMLPEAIAEGIEKLLCDDVLRQSIIETLKQEKIGNEHEIEKLYRLIGGSI